MFPRFYVKEDIMSELTDVAIKASGVDTDCCFVSMAEPIADTGKFLVTIKVMAPSTVGMMACAKFSAPLYEFVIDDCDVIEKK